MLLRAMGFSLISFCISLNGLSYVIVGFDVKCNFGKQLAHNCCIWILLVFIQDVYHIFMLGIWQMVFNVVYLMVFKILV